MVNCVVVSDTFWTSSDAGYLILNDLKVIEDLKLISDMIVAHMFQAYSMIGLENDLHV